MPDLDELMLKWGSDKASSHHDYCPIYEGIFQPQRHRRAELLELGVHQGFSLLAWRDYFDHPETVIAGIDNCLGTSQEVYGTVGPYRPFHQRYGKPIPGICCYLCDQAEIPGGLRDWHPDIVIDDASHHSSKTIASFKTWFPMLKPGGFYVVEDITTSYEVALFGPEEASENPDLPPPLAPQAQTAMQFFRRLADEVQVYAWTRAIPDEHVLGYEIAWITFHPEIVIMRKRFPRATPATTWANATGYSFEWESGDELTPFNARALTEVRAHKVIERNIPLPGTPEAVAMATGLCVDGAHDATFHRPPRQD